MTSMMNALAAGTVFYAMESLISTQLLLPLDPIPLMQPGFYGVGGPNMAAFVFTAGIQDCGACDAGYGFLALQLPLGDLVLFYANIAVAPSFPATAAPWE